MTRAVMVGRFQPFHKGHQRLLEMVADQFQEVCIGIAQITAERTWKNPLTVEERVRCLDAVALGDTQIVIEHPRDCAAGVAEVEAMCGSSFTAVGCNKETLACFRDHGHPVRSYAKHEPDTYSGHAVRQRIEDGRSWRHLVPQEVETVLASIGFEAIIQNDLGPAQTR